MTSNLGRHIFIILVILSIGGPAFAQGGRMMREQHIRREQNMERRLDNQYRPPVDNRQIVQPNPKQVLVQRMRENFVHNQLALTPEQSARFLPLYHQYLLDLFAVQKLKRLNNMDTQANGAEQVQRNMTYEQQIVNIKARYQDEFLKIMPPEKVSLMLKSERQFNDEIYKQLVERNGGQAPPPAN